MEKALAIQQQVQNILGTDEVYLVGGSVRDIVLGDEAKDYDFTTSMLPEEMKKRAKAAGRRVYTIGEKFGTIGFKVPITTVADNSDAKPGDWVTNEHSRTDFHYVEVTTFRSEVYTSKSRKPEVEFVPNLDEDLARRDFTMNAMVLRSDGTIYDPYGGKLDMHARQIKTVGMPKDRIMEDPLRVFRAARFAARYNFSIDPNFIGKARQLADRVYDVAVERWVQELDKLLTSEYSLVGLQSLELMNVIQRVLPELGENPSFSFFGGGHDEPDEAWKELLSCSSSHMLNYADIKTNRVDRFINVGICARFKFSNDRTEKIVR